MSQSPARACTATAAQPVGGAAWAERLMRANPSTNSTLLPRALGVVLVGSVALGGWSVAGLALQRDAVIAGLLIGVLVGLTGMGSGALMAPVLILVVGVPPVIAVGTDLAFAAITKTVGGIEHARQRSVDYRLAGLLALGSVPAGLLSVPLLSALRRWYPAGTIDAVVTRTLGLVLVLSAAALLLGAMRAGRRDQTTRTAAPPRSPLAIVAFGALVGLLVGLTSVGSGSIVVATLTLATPLSPAAVVGTDVVHAIALTSTTGLAQGLAGNIDGRLLLNLLAGSIPGVLLGSRLTGRLPSSLLRAVMAIVLLATGITLL